MFIRVFEMPKFVRPNYRFGGGMPMPFVEVDWFRDDTCPLTDDEARKNMDAFIRGKKYFKADRSYLVLHPTHPMVINCDEAALLGTEREAGRRFV